MPKWRKDFDKWAEIKTEVEVDKVESLLQRVFGSRVNVRTGSSHQLLIDLHELKSDPRFQWGHLMIPIKSGKKVKGVYLRDAFEAAVKLNLYVPDDSDAEQN